MTLCECGCGLEAKPGNRFIHGHNRHGTPHSPETCDTISKAKLGVLHTSEAQIAADERMIGVSLSSETCAKMSKTRRGVPHTTPAQLAADKANRGIERIRGGEDIVNHHLIYDHDDLSRNIMPMTRSMHQRLHRLFQKHGIEIPHINIKEVL